MTVNMTRLAVLIVAAFALVIFLASCQGSYVRSTGQPGFQQRDVFAGGIEEARNSQEVAREHFLAALATFSNVVNFRPGELQRKFEQFNDEYAETRSSAEVMRARITRLENVAQALFDGWRTELGEYTNDAMRRRSQQKFAQARHNYVELVGTMKNVEQMMVPILLTLHDQVLFLKHNLNAQAIAALKNELVVIRAQTAALVEAMDASIAQADSFVSAMDWV